MRITILSALTLMLSGCAAHRPTRVAVAQADDTVDAGDDDAGDDSDVIDGATQGDLERAAKDALDRLYQIRANEGSTRR
jgi:hypothetical protein